MRAVILTAICMLLWSCGGDNGPTRSASQNTPLPDPASPIVPTPASSTFVYRLDTTGEKVHFASIDLVSGEIAEHGAVDLTSGSNPVSLAVSHKKFLFVANAGFNTIDTFELDQTTGEPVWIKSKSAIFDPIKKVVADPLNRFLWSYEGEFPGGYLVTYAIAPDGSLSYGSSRYISDTGQDLAVDATGEFLFALRSADLEAYAIHQGTGSADSFGQSPIGATAYTLAVNADATRLFGSPKLYGDKVPSYLFDSSTGKITFETFLDGGQGPSFSDIALNAAGDRMYLLSPAAPVAIKSFALEYVPQTHLTAINSVSLPTGCAPTRMTHLRAEGYLVLGCTDSSGKTFSVKIEADGSLSLESTSVRPGMKVNDIISVTF